MGYKKRKFSKYYMKSNQGGTASDWGPCNSQREEGTHTLTTTLVPRGTTNTSMDVA